MTAVGEARAKAGPGLLEAAREWRCIGPFRGGRVVAVAGDPSDPMAFYFGACAGGVWKTTDGGTYWENSSDTFFSTASVGAIAVADSDPNVVYAGMGESCIRNDVSHGDGVYRSTDGGRTWEHKGLDDTRHIARIRVHPKDPDLVYVAALGHAFGPNSERGVFRSKNGGATWEQVLFKSENAGAIDLSMDPSNPRVLYAAIWQVLRSFWDISSGGPDSGLYKSTDGGDTWDSLTENPGMPAGPIGRMGVAASPARAGRVWALIEAEDGGVFRSDDGGLKWEKLNETEGVRSRPWYYTHVFADPQDPETVWVLAAQAFRSNDGGRTFDQVATPHGDNHDLWIDPRNPQRMIEGNDGGACVSFNGGGTWSTIYNQPTAQFYDLDTDDRFPYRVYGTQQDNSAISVPSRSYKGAIVSGDWYTHGLSESGDIAVKPDNPDIVYSAYPHGTLNRYDHATGQVRVVTVWPELTRHSQPQDYRYRFAWKFPIVFSPHDPDVLYVAGNVAFKTGDDGTTWEPISTDLTRNDPTKQRLSGGPITAEGADAETYCTIYAFVESPHKPGVFWAGSDDGLVHVSRDNGESWQDVTPGGLPEWTMVHSIEVSPHDAASAYVAATRYKLDDNRPFLFKTNDYGQTWQKITSGIPDDDFTRVIREDPGRRGLLYAGTETGVYVSLDDGESWRPLRINLPVVPIHDMVVKDDDLVVATHGRSFWVLDDLTPLHQMNNEALAAPGHLFKPRPFVRVLSQPDNPRAGGLGKSYMSRVLGVPATSYERPTPDGGSSRVFLDAGQNPPDGVTVTYHFGREPHDPPSLIFRDSKGELIATFSSSEQGENGIKAAVGMNRFVWDTRYPEAHVIEGADDQVGPDEATITGPLAPPGEYQVELTVDGEALTETFDIRQDPRNAATLEDLEAQFALLVSTRDKLSEVHDGVNRIRGVRRQVEQWESRADVQPDAKAVLDAAAALREKLTALENELVLVEPTRRPRATPARLSHKVAAVANVVASADWAPTRQSYQVFEELAARVDSKLLDLQKVFDEDVPAFMSLVREMGLALIVP